MSTSRKSRDDFQTLVEMGDLYMTKKAREQERDHPAMGTEFDFGAREFSLAEEG